MRPADEAISPAWNSCSDEEKGGILTTEGLSCTRVVEKEVEGGAL
jgi:hypothetical protein